MKLRTMNGEQFVQSPTELPAGDFEILGIDLSRTGVRDVGLAPLHALADLRDLNLRDTQVGDAGLEHLGGLKNLQRLNLDNTRVGDSGLAPVAMLTKLQNLSLAGTKVTDSGLRHLRALTDLRDLGLFSTRIGDGGLAQIEGLTALRNLDLNATGGGVTEAPGAGINAGDMESSLGVTGNVSLLGANNQIETIIDFAVTPSAPGQGNFQMKDVASVTIIGTLSATGGNVYLQSNDPEGVEINFQGSIITGPLGTVSLQVDGFLLEQTSFTSGTIVTGTFELAPNTIGQTVILGPTESSGLTLPSHRADRMRQPVE